MVNIFFYKITSLLTKLKYEVVGGSCLFCFHLYLNVFLCRTANKVLKSRSGSRAFYASYWQTSYRS